MSEFYICVIIYNMEKVKDLILYQIVKSRKFSIGDKIIFDKNTITGQYKKVFQTKYQTEILFEGEAEVVEIIKER